MKKLRLILGDQLNSEHSWFQETDENTLYLLAEMRQETDYVKHHIQKVVAFFLSMRNFSSTLKRIGHQVAYFQIHDANNLHDLDKIISFCIEKYKIEKFEFKTEDDIIAFQDKVHRLYNVNDGMLIDCKGEYVNIKLPLNDMYYEFMNRNDRDNIEVLANFIREHDEFDVVGDIIIDEVPYYNQRDLDEDEHYFTQLRLSTWIRIKDQKTFLGKNNTNFSLSRYVDKIAREFAIKYPHMKEY